MFSSVKNVLWLVTYMITDICIDILSAYLLTDIKPEVIYTIRAISAFIVSAIIVALTNSKYRSEENELKYLDISLVLFLGYSCYLFALKYGSLTIMQSVNHLIPGVTIFLAWLLRSYDLSDHKKNIISISGFSLVGICIALVPAIAMALYMLSYSLNTIMLVIAACLSVLYFSAADVLYEGHLKDNQDSIYTMLFNVNLQIMWLSLLPIIPNLCTAYCHFNISYYQLTLLALSGILQTIATLTLIRAINNMSAISIQPFKYLMIPMALCADAIVFHKAFTAHHWTSIVVIISVSVLVLLNDYFKQESQPEATKK